MNKIGVNDNIRYILGTICIGVIMITILLLTGCNNKNDYNSRFQVGKSELTAGFGYTKVQVDIKNISDNDCNNMIVVLEFKNGEIIIEDTYHTYHDLTVGEIYTLNYYNFEESYEGYTATIQSIYCSNN